MKTDWKQIDQLRAGLAAPRLRVDQEEGQEVKLLSYDFNDKKRFPNARGGRVAGRKASVDLRRLP